MTNFTQNQKAAITVLISSCLNNMGGETLADLQADPFTWADEKDLIEAGWDRKQAEGTFGSLVAAGVVFEYEPGEFSLTGDWELLAKFHA